MSIKLITAALELPVAIEEFRDHLRADSCDADMALKLSAACRSVERAAGYPLIHSEWDWYSCEWPERLPHFQVSSVSVKYLPVDGSLTTIETSVYSASNLYDEATPLYFAGECSIVLKYGQLWPYVVLARGESIVTRIISGWKDAASVPEDIKLAILLEAAHLYRDRESVTAAESRVLARGVDHLLSPYVRHRW